MSAAPNLKMISLSLLGSTLLYMAIPFVLAFSGSWVFSWTVGKPTLLIILGAIGFMLGGAALLLGKLPLLVRLALAEGVGILGLVAAFLNQSPFWALPFGVFSLLLQGWLSPFLARGPGSDLQSR